MDISMIAGNWKMNTTVNEARELVSKIKLCLKPIPRTQVIICPPFVSLATLAETLCGSTIELGAQNIYHEDRGAYTGEISPQMLVDLCKFVILGHSERRHFLGESDDFINKKVKASLKAGLQPILCIGERVQDRDHGRAETVTETQLRICLDGVGSSDGLVVAYEPIWAIGTGKAATPSVAQSMMRHVRETLASLFGPGAADNVPLLYGGSVSPDNISHYMREPDINGALVGGASLKADSFVDIIRKAAQVKA